jgi:hypothetical protein
MQHSVLFEAGAPSYYIPVVKELLSADEEEEEGEGEKTDHCEAGEDTEEGARRDEGHVDNNELRSAKNVFRTVFREASHSQTGAPDHVAAEVEAPNIATTASGSSRTTHSHGLGRHVSATTTFVAGTTDEPESVTWMCFLRK